MNRPLKNNSLAFCLVMDLIGYATYAVPVLGELGDIIWAPLSAIVFYFTFGSWKGSLFNFTEEILPGFDFIPSFTLMWVWKRLNGRKSGSRKESFFRSLRLPVFRTPHDTTNR